jgi:hypothetical protein
VESAERFSTDFSNVQGFFLRTVAQNRDFAKFMITEKVWWLILRMLSAQLDNGKICPAQAALYLVEADPESLVSEKFEEVRVFEVLTVLGGELRFESKIFVEAALMMGLRDVGEASFAEMWASDIYLRSVIESLVDLQEEFMELRFQTVVRIFEACAMAEERLTRLEAIAAETEEFLMWLTELVTDDRIPAELVGIVAKFCARFEGLLTMS